MVQPVKKFPHIVSSSMKKLYNTFLKEKNNHNYASKSRTRLGILSVSARTLPVWEGSVFRHSFLFPAAEQKLTVIITILAFSSFYKYEGGGLQILLQCMLGQAASCNPTCCSSIDHSS